jgi:putative salt-induced outer membrane protein YdiY
MRKLFAKASGCCGCVALLVFALTSYAAQERPAAAISTNLVLVTNAVVVTNYVVSTNRVIVTNGAAVATNQPLVAKTGPRLPDVSWVPPEDDFDWVQLKSGEWLKGKLKAMQDQVLEFDSEEMELQTFDWKDIRQLRSSHTNEMLFESFGLFSGPVNITPDFVRIGGGEPRSFPRADLQSITPGGAGERNLWSGRVSLGLSIDSGNTSSVDYNAQVRLQRRTPITRLSIDYLGNVSTQNDVQSANNHRVTGEFDYWLSRRLYLIVPRVEYYRDTFQNIDHRNTLGGGVGYDLIDRKRLEWNVSAGPAYQNTVFNSVPAGEPAERNAAALTFGSKLDWDITQRIELLLEYQGQYTSRSSGETYHHTVSTLSIDITKRFDLDISFIWDRTQNPRPNSSGVVPKKDDFRLVVGLGMRF